MQELDIAMSHVRTIHRVAGMTGREKMHFHLACSQVKGVEQQQLVLPYTTRDIRDIKTSLPSNLSLPGAMKMHEIFVRPDGSVRSKKLSDDGAYNIVRLKLSNIAKNRNLQEVEVEESEPDRNISDSDSDW